MSDDALAALRTAHPVLSETVYLNAGTCGPLSWTTADALGAGTTRAAVVGRAGRYYEELQATHTHLRHAYAGALGSEPEDVAITTSTSDGLARVLDALPLGPGDEVVTADDEHPGLNGPLTALRDLRGVTVRAVPLADVADAVGPKTRAVACSHVSWKTGALAPVDALREVGKDVPVIYDGAQGVGAIPVDPASLGCAAYAGAGQKWLCGPVGLGMLWVAPRWADALRPFALSYGTLQDPSKGLDAEPWPDARRFDASAISSEIAAAGAAATDQLAEIGWETVFARGAELADSLAHALAERGLTVAPRGRTTLVSFEVDDPMGVRDRLGERKVVVRDLPGTPYVRASTGAWNTETDLERLLAALA
ncbi:MAG: aminotransferase class V-fold PLP-dependent enzyme [Solirubrobacteraceae bacterium]|nr:aminotransferase class V-fold PLP-dependent enzyme [Solirubrobacteraceae bacterium]